MTKRWQARERRIPLDVLANWTVRHNESRELFKHVESEPHTVSEPECSICRRRHGREIVHPCE
jgi:hypothetical protein